MKTTITSLFITVLALAADAQLLEEFVTSLAPTSSNRVETAQNNASLGSGEMKISGGYISANAQTGEMTASNGVTASSGSFRFFSEDIRRDKLSLIDFGTDPMMTTCTNHKDHLHWRFSGKAPFDWLPSGSFTFQDSVYTNAEGKTVHRALTMQNMWAYWYDIPVLWIPFWYYPLDTNYGWRFLPGYTSRWGGFFLSGYVYNIVNEGIPDKYGLGGSSYLDYRTKNGFALGQTLRWHLKDFGEGKIKVWHAWDEDYDYYTRRWHSSKYNYRNWSSPVERERYRVGIEHKADFTERDSLRLQAQHLSDSQVIGDFFRYSRNDVYDPVNELWYEHRENSYAVGGSVGGPIDRFYGGTQRLPEGWLSIEPQPIWDLPLNYESQTRAGYLNRDAARYNRAQTAFSSFPYIGSSGDGADYQAFRADSAHRVTLPMKFWDVLSFVPRANYRCTWWNDSGDSESGYTSASGDSVARNLVEIGATASARASGWLNDNFRHTFEPYLDYSFQKVNLSQNSGNRYYRFDSYDRSLDWRDQFGFEGRGLPYSWHGIRPGIRNFLQQRDEKGVLRTILDTDLYLAIPFDDEDYYSWDYRGTDKTKRALRGRPRDDEYGYYNRSECVVPGFFTRYTPTRDVSFSTRVEYDCEENRFAYADVSLTHRINESLSWNISYIGRDYQVWDYLATEPIPQRNGNTDRWNRELANIFHLDFTHNVCDWLALSPFIRFDARRNEMEESGLWVDFLSDCLGYRLEFVYDAGYHRIDGSKDDSDVKVTFFIYLRALGPGSTMDLMKF